MLEIRNITKVYRSKTGEEVRALDNVSITFPESGMVFILGKSGSGKSTLLNVMGGLDGYDEGEFIIKGKSSKDFVGSDFDAYRNTFIGFIFQEYNMLDDFSVGANIGLALELQGKKATNEAVGAILEKVDLLNYAKRKPNELSGGQKQRVAIARALVKEPEIIMADEPTGALDSNTGKQIFDTLKELSRQKLVLVVSHDRDFAEKYADRIIELADGKVIEDVTKHEHLPERISDGVHRINEHILRIERGYRLSVSDLEMINAYLEKHNGDVLLSGDTRVNDELRSAAGISKEGNTAVFESTAPKDVRLKSYDGERTGFIRSRLPMKNAVKMGASGLKHKKVRLVFTILLSLIAFAMFGIADTMAAYNKINAATTSIQNANIETASFGLHIKETHRYEDEVRNTYDRTHNFNEQDLLALSERTGLDWIPVLTGSEGVGQKTSFSSHFLEGNKGTHLAYPGGFSGFSAMTRDQLDAFGFSLVGHLPETSDDIVITKHTFDQFAYYGYKNNQSDVRIDGENLSMVDTGDPDSIIGQRLELQIGNTETKSYTVVGVLDTRFDATRYAEFLPGTTDDSSGGGVMDQMKQMELNNTLNYDVHCIALLCEEEVSRLALATATDRNQTLGTHLNNMRLEAVGSQDGNYISFFYRISDASALLYTTVEWLDGNPRTELAENEIVISRGAYANWQRSEVIVKAATVDWDQNGNQITAPYAEYTDWVVVGVHEEDEELLISDFFYEEYREYALNNGYSIFEYAAHKSGAYSHVFAPMPRDEATLKKLVEISYEEGDDVVFRLKNHVMDTLKVFNEFVEPGAKIFLFVGLGLALFASLLLMNFIATSISYKKREIGILRAVGARSSDVFKIFFSESAIIAAINFLLALVAAVITTVCLNNWMANEGISVTLLNFGLRQVVLMLGISLLTALLASFLPVYRIARKKPVDAIKDR